MRTKCSEACRSVKFCNYTRSCSQFPHQLSPTYTQKAKKLWVKKKRTSFTHSRYETAKAQQTSETAGINYVRTRKSFVYLPSQYFNLPFTAGISPTSLLSYFNDETRVYLLFEIRGSFDMLQQSHPEGRQTFKSTNIFLTRWPETDLVVIDTILSLLLFRRHADTIDGLRCDVATASLRNCRKE